jgi:hypothetical protein
MGWDTERAQASPIFEPLRVHGGAVFDTAWPGLEDFQRLLDARDPPVRVSSGLPLRFVPQGRKPNAFQEKYEPRIYLKGELQVRRDHWHDTFNALVWLAFPLAKAALNARQYSALEAQRAAGAPNRGPAQDALTLFDEGGVVVASSDDGLLELLRGWRWKELFWANRARFKARMHFALFGHAIHEKALRPFLGITARGILLSVEPELLSAPPRERLAELDARLAAHLSDPGRMLATRELAVVPILGVPGWCADNENEAFYDNTDYFRSGRSREKRDS